jgi:hypothetical protein
VRTVRHTLPLYSLADIQGRVPNTPYHVTLSRNKLDDITDPCRRMRFHDLADHSEDSHRKSYELGKLFDKAS